MIKKISLVVFLLIPLLHFGQDIAKVNFDEKAYNERYFKSKLVIPLFKYVDNTIEEYEKFGVANKKPLKTFSIKKFPDMSGALDTAYGFIYYSGVNTDINRGYVTILVNNYKRQIKDAVIYVDKNNNLDFTDDGQQDTFSAFDPSLDIHFAHPKQPNAKYSITISRFSFNQDATYRFLMDDYYKKNQGNKVFAGIDYSFKENRNNMRGATYANGLDTFRIALLDGNFDGLYNSAEYDKIFVAKKNDSIFLDDFSFPIEERIKKTEFEWNEKVYRITEFDPAGNYIKFFWDKNAISKKALRIGKKLPKFSFYLHDSKTTKKIRKYKRKGLYIYFYNTDNPTFSSDTAALGQIHKKYGNCINIITLNYGDYYKTISSIKIFGKKPYTMGLSSRALNRKFNIETLPQGFLCRKRLRLAYKDISPHKVLELLDKGSKKEKN